jgi:hypothetical protein
MIYDKWGNIIYEDGTRLPGELFWDESVQKALRSAGMLGRFQTRVKYPRTYHLPWSEGVGRDDRVMASIGELIGSSRVIVTEKMDGENTTMYNDYIHARSLDSPNHFTRNWVKNYHAQIAHEIPDGYRICGENLYGQHAIEYSNLPTYFMVFSIWNRATCLSWDDTVEWCELLGLQHVPVLLDHELPTKESLDRLWKYETQDRQSEGYVVRTAEAFEMRDFRWKVGKFVRANHVSSDNHWRAGNIKTNSLTT